MADHRNEAQPSGVDEQLPPTPDEAEQLLHDIRAVNEQLVLAGLREQRLAEQLRHQLAFTTAITTSLGEGVYVLDTAGQCTFVNPAAERLLGWTLDELSGKGISAVIPQQAVQSVSDDTAPAPIIDVLRFGTTQRNDDALFVHRDGGMFPAAYSAAPIISDGQVVGAVVTFRDMTEVQRLQRARDEYLALISHDLRAPLTAIMGRAQILVRLLTEHGLTREVESAKVIVTSSLRMNEMIESLLERSRTDAGLQARHRSAVDLVVLVRQMIGQTVGPEERGRVRLEAIPELPAVVEAAQIERVVVNLLTNALKFSPRNQPIRVQVSQQGTNAMIAVSDQGIGIAPEDLPRLFEKHYRAQSVGQIAGSGLGLYGSRLIVEAHGGELRAESTLGQGSTFTVVLPLPA